MATTAPQPIVCRTKTEQGLYDQLLLHPGGIELSRLNVHRAKRRRAALDRWVAEGWVHLPNPASSYAVATLDPAAVDHARQVVLWAEQVMDAWHVLAEAEERLAGAHRAQMDELRRTRAILTGPAPYDDAAQDIVWDVKAWEWHPGPDQQDIGEQVAILDRTRADVEAAGGNWAEVTARCEELHRDGQARVARERAEEAAHADALRAGADPLGGDA